MFLLVVIAVTVVGALVCGFLKACGPSNVLIRHARSSRPTYRIAILVGLLAFICVSGCHIVWIAIDAGAPRWLNLAALILAWDSIKFGVLASLTAVKRTGSLVCGR